MIVKIATAAPKHFSPKTKQTISVVYDPAQGITTAQILADTTTIGVNPFSIASFTLIATCFRLSSVDTDVPPNFCTIIFKEISSLAKL